jgi:hypothetical protein
VQALARDLRETAARVGPDLRDVAERADRAGHALDGLAALLPPARRAQAAEAFAALGRAATAGSEIARQVQAITDGIERGDGTVGGFARDREIYEDFHETHRILKSQPWQLILKTRPHD